MSLCCTVCGLWYPGAGRDRLDICTPCLEQNFSGAQPPLDPWTPHDPPDHDAREALEAFVDSAHQLTPRQVQAMARLAEAWRRQEDA